MARLLHVLWPSCSWLPRLSVLVCVASFLSTELGCTRGMQLTSTGPQTVQKAEGEIVTLGCTYTPSPIDTGELDIEWSVVSPDTTKKDELLISYTGGTKYIHSNHELANGLDFAVSDPSMGDASLSIARLTPGHSATYQCKVKKSPGVDMRKVSLVVMAKPSVPKCWMEGTGLVGEPVSLHCKSAKGSPPLKYMWNSQRGGPMPSLATQNSDTGELIISNHSHAFSGIYRCEVTNAVGTEQCRINLRADKPPNRAGRIVGTVVGSLLLLILVLLFVWLLICKLGNRMPGYEKEVANEIRMFIINHKPLNQKGLDHRPLNRKRLNQKLWLHLNQTQEDAPAPESRPASRVNSRSASHYQGVVYNQVGSPESRTCSPSSTTNPAGTPVKYDSKYGYAV